MKYLLLAFLACLASGCATVETTPGLSHDHGFYSPQSDTTPRPYVRGNLPAVMTPEQRARALDVYSVQVKRSWAGLPPLGDLDVEIGHRDFDAPLAAPYLQQSGFPELGSEFDTGSAWRQAGLWTTLVSFLPLLTVPQGNDSQRTVAFSIFGVALLGGVVMDSVGRVKQDHAAGEFNKQLQEDVNERLAPPPPGQPSAVPTPLPKPPAFDNSVTVKGTARDRRLLLEPFMVGTQAYDPQFRSYFLKINGRNDLAKKFEHADEVRFWSTVGMAAAIICGSAVWTLPNDQTTLRLGVIGGAVLVGGISIFTFEGTKQDFSDIEDDFNARYGKP